jgi:hypothetical protein
MLSFLSPYLTYLKIALAVAVFAAGFGVAFHMQQGKIDGLNERLGGYEQTIGSMQALIADSNKQIEELAAESNKRQKDAADAVRIAQAAADDSETIAHAILTSKPTIGVNRCVAAQKAFSDELMAERNTKK